MFNHIVQVLIYPLFSTLLLYGFAYSDPKIKNYMFMHVLFISSVGAANWYLGGAASAEYLRRLVILFAIFFPLSIAIGFFSVRISARKNTNIAAYRRSLVEAWTGGSFLTLALAS